MIEKHLSNVGRPTWCISILHFKNCNRVRLVLGIKIRWYLVGTYVCSALIVFLLFQRNTMHPISNSLKLHFRQWPFLR